MNRFNREWEVEKRARAIISLVWDIADYQEQLAIPGQHHPIFRRLLKRAEAALVAAERRYRAARLACPNYNPLPGLAASERAYRATRLAKRRYPKNASGEETEGCAGPSSTNNQAREKVSKHSLCTL
jgi:hypothetical protein